MALKIFINGLTVISVVCFFWTLVYPLPYEAAVGVSVALMPIAALLKLKFTDRVTILEYKFAKKPTLLSLLLFPQLGLLFRNLDYHLIVTPVFWGVWIIFSIILLGFWGIVFFKSGEFQDVKKAGSLGNKIMLFFLAAAIVAYSYGLMVHLNCLLDNSPAQRYTATVTDTIAQISKSSRTGKNTVTYYLQVKPWGPFTKESKIEVSYALYENTNGGDELPLHLRRGFLGINWYVPCFQGNPLKKPYLGYHSLLPLSPLGFGKWYQRRAEQLLLGEIDNESRMHRHKIFMDDNELIRKFLREDTNESPEE